MGSTENGGKYVLDIGGGGKGRARKEERMVKVGFLNVSLYIHNV